MANNFKLIVDTSLGYAGVGLRNDVIHMTWLPEKSLKNLERKIRQWAKDAVFASDKRLEAKIERYFEGQKVEFDEPVAMAGASDYSAKVYANLRKIRWGKTVSYGALARITGKKDAARAVGSIMAKNVAPLIIPCHRVIRADGGMGGFTAAGGIDMKLKMLQMEGSL